MHAVFWYKALWEVKACDLSLILVQTVPYGVEGVKLFEENKMTDMSIH